MDRIKELEIEIQRLKKGILYLSIAFAISAISMFCTQIRQLKDYAIIRDYYQSTQEVNQEILQNQKTVNHSLEELLLNLQ